MDTNFNKSSDSSNIVTIIIIGVVAFLIFRYVIFPQRKSAENFKLNPFNNQGNRSRDFYARTNNMLNDQGEPLTIRNTQPRVLDKVRFDEQNAGGLLGVKNQLELQKVKDTEAKVLDKVSQPTEPTESASDEQVSCNMLNMDPRKLSEYQKNFYDMYKHQVECPKNCYLSQQYPKKCGLKDGSNCGGVVTSTYNNPDTNALAYMNMDKLNSKQCVTCTEKPGNLQNYRSLKLLENNLEGRIPAQDSEDAMRQKIEETNQEKVNELRYENRNKFADFRDKVDRNGVAHTQVDKIAELRASENPSTCGLANFGQSIRTVYDNLLSTPYTNNKNYCNSHPITGYLSTAAPTLDYEPL